MSELIKAAGEAKKLVNMLRGVEEIAKALELVGSIDQAEKDARKATEAARNEKDKADLELAGVRADIEQAKLNAKNEVELGKEKAAKIIEKAEQAAAKMASDADKKMADSEDAIGRAKQILSGLSDEISSKRKELDGLDSKIENARQYLAKMAAA